MAVDSGILYVVATPIGNLDDISPRAREILASVELIAAEDTRRTGRLLTHFGINTRLLSCHEHNESKRVPQIIERLEAGADIALVSDAGTTVAQRPGLSFACRGTGTRTAGQSGARLQRSRCSAVSGGSADGPVSVRSFFARLASRPKKTAGRA